MEHLYEGPTRFLREAHRVLATGGRALISVPHFHSLRRLKARLGLYRGDPSGFEFYQYAFTKDEFVELVERAGFRVLSWSGYDSYKGLKDEISLVRRLFAYDALRARAQTDLRRLRLFETSFGHMQLLVCEKLRRNEAGSC
jgi:SAM-dependent methyltransferase